MSHLRRPRCSPLDLAVLLLVAVVASTLATRAILRREYDNIVGEALVSPLPDVILAKSVPGPTDPGDERYTFTQDWVTRNIPVWEKALARFRGEPNISYLEIGAFVGRSVLWMLENILTHPSATVTAIDTVVGPCREVYQNNIQRSGLGDEVTTIADFSQLALRHLPLASFDIIYVDGSHRKADVLEDAVLSWRLLKQGGLNDFRRLPTRRCYQIGPHRDGVPQVRNRRLRSVL